VVWLLLPVCHGQRSATEQPPRHHSQRQPLLPLLLLTQSGLPCGHLLLLLLLLHWQPWLPWGCGRLQLLRGLRQPLLQLLLLAAAVAAETGAVTPVAKVSSMPCDECENIVLQCSAVICSVPCTQSCQAALHACLQIDATEHNSSMKGTLP
jgi:hypothetical protein